MRVYLISTYELGRQPFGIASAAAWLRRAGHSVQVADLAVQRLGATEVESADLIGFYVPMHTAMRISLEVLSRVRDLNPSARVCFFGLYGPTNAELLKTLNVVPLGGEFEEQLVALADGQETGTTTLKRLPLLKPDRAGLPPLTQYAKIRQKLRPFILSCVLGQIFARRSPSLAGPIVLDRPATTAQTSAGFR